MSAGKRALGERFLVVGRSVPLSHLTKAIPNILSCARIGLGLLFPCVPASWRPALVVIAALTDMFDGVASRQFDAISTLGRFLDPLADKIFVLAVVLTLIVEGTLEIWQAVLVGLRDGVVLAGAAWVLLRRDGAALKRMRPTLLSKLATAAQFIFLLTLLLVPEWGWLVFGITAVLSGLAAADLAIHFFARMTEEAPN